MSISEEKLHAMIRASVREALADQEKTRASAQPQENHIDHTANCPDCFTGLIEKMNKISEYACHDCGLPLGNKAFIEKIEKCPNCGSQRAPKKVER